MVPHIFLNVPALFHFLLPLGSFAQTFDAFGRTRVIRSIVDAGH